jgi:thioredoxin-like negative regulator of GroEL
MASGPVAAEFVRWLTVQGKSAEAERWLAGLPAPVAGTPQVSSVRMELAIVAKDWDQFGRLLEQGAWGPIPPEVARLAMAAHLAGARKASLRKQIWDEVMAAAGDNLTTDRVLLRVATAWRWEDETESLLWSVVRLDPAQAWAHSALLSVYRQRGDGKKMLEVMTVLKNAAPTSQTYRHDWALLSLLVSPLSDWDDPKITAKEVYLADPANPNYAATYALALAESGNAEEARVVLEKLSIADREYPLRAPYLAFVYGHCRRPADFEKYAALAANAQLLHEEHQLIDQAREYLTRPIALPAAPAKPPAKAPITAKSPTKL